MNRGGEPLRVCLVGPKLYPLFNPRAAGNFGGAEVDLYHLAVELAKDEAFRVSAIVADYGQAPAEMIQGVALIRGLDFREGTWRGMIRLWRAFRQAAAEVYLIKTISSGVAWLGLFCRRYGKTLVYRTSSSPAYDRQYRRDHPFQAWLFARTLRRAGLILAQSEEAARALPENFGVTADRVIPNGHPLPRRPGLPREYVLWVGRAARIKRPELFLELASRFPEERFVMICPPATADREYPRLVDQIRRQPNVQLSGQVPYREMDEWFARAKVLVNTSDSEGFPNTFIQAAAAAVPVLSLNADPDQFLEKFDCGICAAGSPDRLAAGLQDLLRDGRYAGPGANARRYVEEHHDLTRIVPEYKRLLAGVAAAPAGGRRRKIRKSSRPAAGPRFAFGENWQAYVQQIGPADFERARQSLHQLVPDLAGRTFLDIGCGSGIFTVAAASLGARRATGMDADEKSIAASRDMLAKAAAWDAGLLTDRIRFTAGSILDPGSPVEPAGVVYCWGVLHHTGDLWRACAAVPDLVRPGGMLVLSIYNRHWSSPFWKIIKRSYQWLPSWLRPLPVWLFVPAKLLVALIFRRENPFRRRRGMRFYRDLVDWVGGYPYEYASREEVAGFFQARGLKLQRFIPAAGGTGCNQYVFGKSVAPAAGPDPGV